MLRGTVGNREREKGWKAKVDWDGESDLSDGSDISDDSDRSDGEPLMDANGSLGMGSGEHGSYGSDGSLDLLAVHVRLEQG